MQWPAPLLEGADTVLPGGSESACRHRRVPLQACISRYDIAQRPERGSLSRLVWWPGPASTETATEEEGDR